VGLSRERKENESKGKGPRHGCLSRL
jgi:hypothetical protein